MLDFREKKLILTVEVCMALAIESLYGTQGYVDALGRPVYVAEIEQAREKATLVEHVARMRPPVHEGVLPDGVQDLLQATGVFDAVGREERKYQKVHGETSVPVNVIDFTTRRPIEQQVYSAPRLAATGDS